MDQLVIKAFILWLFNTVFLRGFVAIALVRLRSKSPSLLGSIKQMRDQGDLVGNLSYFDVKFARLFGCANKYESAVLLKHGVLG
jgi:hypothetical protein